MQTIDLKSPQGKDDCKKAMGGMVLPGPETTLQLTARQSCITTIIPGVPIGKPRMTRRDKWKQRPCVMRYRAWADAARAAVGPLPSPERIQRFAWVAYFEPPKSWSKKERAAAMGTLHRSKPDRDNVDKAVLDVLFKHDSAIASGLIEKRWGSPARLEITIQVAG